MNLICIPYHDWRKIEAEGTRTRDSHLIHHFSNNSEVEKLLIINRPISLSEILIKRKKWALNGEVVFKKDNGKLYKLKNNVYVLDFFTTDILSPFIKGRLWAFDSFGYVKLFDFFKQCLNFLEINDFNLITNNIFSLHFVEKMDRNQVVFDAYDNLVFFPNNKKILPHLKSAYSSFVHSAKFWITNSSKNQNYYKENYGQEKCFLIKNGVDIEVFKKKYVIPKDLAELSKPIIGFGGKITHLFDYNLFNYVTENNPDKSFVIVGQILNKDVFAKINKNSNVYYLGDKPYQTYLSYVCNFDVGIVPYVTDELESGVDSIKIYEYIAAGLNCVGTMGGGMPDMKEYIFLAKDKEEFSRFVSDALNEKLQKALPESQTWSYKANGILNLIKEQ